MFICVRACVPACVRACVCVTLKFFSIYHNTVQVMIKHVCQSDNNIQDLLISSRLNDLTNC